METINWKKALGEALFLSVALFLAVYPFLIVSTFPTNVGINDSSSAAAFIFIQSTEFFALAIMGLGFLAYAYKRRFEPLEQIATSIGIAYVLFYLMRMRIVQNSLLVQPFIETIGLILLLAIVWAYQKLTPNEPPIQMKKSKKK